MMKRKTKHTKKDNITEQTAVWLIQTIDAELTRGEEADEQLIRECAEYLQELSPDTAVPAAVTEKRLQAELKAAPHGARRRAPRVAVRVVLRLAAVLTVLVMFCVALPAMAIHVSGRKNFEDPSKTALDPVLSFLSTSIKPAPVDYTDTTEFTKEPGYTAIYTDTKEMIRGEQPPDILCPNGLTEKLTPYQITVNYYGYDYRLGNHFDAWTIQWRANNGRWRFSATCRTTFKPLDAAYYETRYDSYESGGHTCFYWKLGDGSYRAFFEYDRLMYYIDAYDYETMIFLIDHATPASRIIPAAAPPVAPDTDTDTDTAKTVDLLDPTQYERPHLYRATYGTTAEFIQHEGIHLLAVDDAAEGLGDFTVKAQHGTISKTNPTIWSVRWESTDDRWSVCADFLPEDQEYHRVDYEETPRYTEQYPINGRTFYITKKPLQPLDQPDNDPQEYLVNYFEGNLIYSIHVTGRDMLELLLSSLAMTEELAAKS